MCALILDDGSRHNVILANFIYALSYHGQLPCANRSHQESATWSSPVSGMAACHEVAAGLRSVD